MANESQGKVIGYLPNDVPPLGAMLSLGFQQVLTMFPATVLVAILTKFDVGVTLLASGIGTMVALFVSGRKIPMYYGSSFSYISVVITTMNLYAKDAFSQARRFLCGRRCPDRPGRHHRYGRPRDPRGSPHHARGKGRLGQGLASRHNG